MKCNFYVQFKPAFATRNGVQTLTKITAGRATNSAPQSMTEGNIPVKFEVEIPPSLFDSMVTVVAEIPELEPIVIPASVQVPGRAALHRAVLPGVEALIVEFDTDVVENEEELPF
jgi:hypothetical protein